MHRITNYGILYEDTGNDYIYPIFHETGGNEIFLDLEGKEHISSHTNLKECLTNLKNHYQSLGYFNPQTNSFKIKEPAIFTSCSLFDIAFNRQDKNNRNLSGIDLVSTEVSHSLRGAYNHGLIQILSTHNMSVSLIEIAIQKIHTEELISPFALAQGLCFRKIEAGWIGKEYTLNIE